ncbi:MAG: phenylalanine--tRNA ligase subunit beta [Planctomycetes bacterium]|nr:phenylalanine--tRNA ligase subunit beta [Planctomycetota bacterium]
MPTFTAQLRDLETLAGKTLRPEALDDILAYAKAEGKGFDPATGEVRIEGLDTNRPDLWCVEGVARQVRPFAGGEPRAYRFWTRAGEAGRVRKGREIAVDPKLREIRPYVGAFTARGVRVDEDALVGMIQTQEKICENYGRKRRAVAIGIYNASRIRFPVRYRAVDPHEVSFVPLGMEEELDLEAILERHPKGADYRYILTGLPLYPILMDSRGTVLSFPPIINSRALGEVMVGDDFLFVEATGPDIRQVALSLNILAANFADRGMRIEPVRTVLPYDSPFGREVVIPCDFAEPIDLDVAEVCRTLGRDLAAAEVRRILAACGCRVQGRGGRLRVATPPYRDDYMHARDPIEDIAIAIGYNEFEPILPSTFTVGKLHRLTLYADRVREIFAGFGLEEIFSNLLLGRPEIRDRLRIEAPAVSIDNVMSESYAVVRDRVLPSLLRVEAASSKAAYPHRLFEVGEVAIPDPAADHGSRTEEHAAVILAEPEAGFSQAHAILDRLLYFLVRPYELRRIELPFTIEGRAAEIVCAGRPIGIIGEVHPEVLERFGIAMPCAFFEVGLNSLLDAPAVDDAARG